MVIDGRKGDVDEFRTVERIGELCKEFKTDGLMILGGARSVPGMTEGVDFTMEFYNPDGTGGMMCGNGGRCITAFADMLGLKPAAEDGTWHFLAPDGPHEAKILDRSFVATAPQDDKCVWTVRLKMIDVSGITPMMGGYFLNTGTRHFVKFVDDVDSIDMEQEAKPLRWDPAFQPVGTNVNFVERRPDGLHIRTYEKGVEGETLACGTGITASAIASIMEIPGTSPRMTMESQRMTEKVKLQCRRGDWLTVEFDQNGQYFTNVYLTGPAEVVAVLKNGPKTRMTRSKTGSHPQKQAKNEDDYK